MAEQDFPDRPARLAISPATQYARAGVRDDDSPPVADPAEATFLTGRAGGQVAPAPPSRRRADEPGARLPGERGDRPRYVNGQYAPGPLAERADHVSAVGHARHGAAQNRLDQLAAAVDYLRSAIKAGERAGFKHGPTEIAVDRATADLMAAGDRHTAAMRTWSAES